MKIFSFKNILCAGLLVFTSCAESDYQEANSALPHWEISPEYISNTLLQSNAALAEEIKYKQLIPLDTADLPQAYPHYKTIAWRMGLHPLPALYVDTTDDRSLPQAAARFTREGKSYILINQHARDLWSERQLVAVLAHELVHLRQRHVTAQNLALAYNHPELSIAHELEADRVGSGPLGSCDPLALEDALQIVVNNDEMDYLSKNPTMNISDYNALVGADHPQWQQRKAILDAMAANPPQGCH